MTSKQIKIATIAPAVLAAYLSFYTVRETEFVLVTQFGSPVWTVTGAGLHFKWPFQSVLRFDRRLRIYNPRPSEFLTRDKKNLVIENYVAWRIADPNRFVQSVGDAAAAEMRLHDIIWSGLSAAIGTQNLDSLVAFHKKRGALATIGLVPADEVFPELQADQFMAMFRELLRRYRQTLSTDRRHLLEQYRFSQMARKVVGVGSVGTRVWVVLLEGPGPEDVLFLQAKEAEASVLERFTKKSQYGNHGARVVAGQRLMQASSDIFLGWQRSEGLDGSSHDYYVRQLQDWKGSIDTETMVPQGLEAYGSLCAVSLARAHARSGDRFAMAAYLGNSDSFEKALAKFAESYADQNERDYEAFAAACKSGRLHAEMGM